jgi:phosphate:Na+ symporter
MTSILEASVPHEVVEEVRRQMRIVDEWESVSDYISRVAKAQRRLHRGGLQLSKEDRARLLQLHDHTLAYLEFVARAVAANKPEALKAGRDQADAVTQEAKDLARDTEERTPPLDPRLDAVYNRQILGYRRIRDHLLNIAQTFSGEK